MIKAELTKNCKKKSFLILTIILAILSISWLISVYVSSIKTIEMGMEYTDTQLVLLEPQNIFFQCMSQITLSLYIFPFIIYALYKIRYYNHFYNIKHYSLKFNLLTLLIHIAAIILSFIIFLVVLSTVVITGFMS